MSNNKEERLRDLIESNASRIPKLEEQLQRLQLVLNRNNKSPAASLSSKHVKEAENKLQKQQEEFQIEYERQVKVMNEIDSQIKEMQQRGSSDASKRETETNISLSSRENIIGTYEWFLKWSKKLSPLMMFLVIYLIARRR
jgi:hypothetical protein